MFWNVKYETACVVHNILRLKLRSAFREAAKKLIFLVARPLRGGGVRGVPLGKKEHFFFINMALLAQKLWRIFFGQNPFSAILRRRKKSSFLRLPLVFLMS